MSAASLDGGEIRCHFCASICESTIKADKIGWNWFTGYLPNRVAACLDCRKAHSLDLEYLRRKSRKPIPLPKAKSTKYTARKIILT